MVGGVREDAERCAQARGGYRQGAQLRLGGNAGVNASRPHASNVTGIPRCSQRSPEVVPVSSPPCSCARRPTANGSAAIGREPDHTYAPQTSWWLAGGFGGVNVSRVLDIR